jgi:N-acetylglucosamine-6-phosphate deacetylase
MPGTSNIQIFAAKEVFDGARRRRDHAVIVRDGIVVDLLPCQQLDPVVIPHAALLAPGLVDIQVNGGDGVLLNDDPTPSGVRHIVDTHRRLGTTSLLPTLITDAPEKLERLADVALVPGAIGFHLEGPLINAARVGIHPPHHVRPLDTRTKQALRRFGSVGSSLATLAPETVPDDLIAHLVASGLTVSAGHTMADAATFTRALDAGLTGVTHLFNAMAPIAARAPGIAGVAFDDARVFAGIICDGLHVAPLTLRMAYRLMGAGRLMLISDAMPSVGSTRTQFDLLGRQVERVGNKLAASDGTLAGAHLDMATSVRNAVAMMGATLDDALTMASATPARFLGLAQTRGHLTRGAAFDAIELDAALEVRNVYVA